MPWEELENPRESRNKEDRSKRVGGKGNAVKSGIFLSHLGNDHLSWRETASTWKETEVRTLLSLDSNNGPAPVNPAPAQPSWLHIPNWKPKTRIPEQPCGCEHHASTYDSLCVLLRCLVHSFMFGVVISFNLQFHDFTVKTVLFIFQCICCFLLYLKMFSMCV